MSILQVNEINIVQDDNQTILFINSDEGDKIFSLTSEQLLKMQESIETIIDPGQIFRSRLKKLKEFKRVVYKDYISETDPEKKAQKLELYIETKKIVTDLEGKGT